jgi:1,4-alpha-glucan branching enzyme
MDLIKGYVALVLHAHLPYVRHPEQDNMLEERWLFEAISETYLPLLNTFEQLENEGVDFRLTISLTPPLLTMLTDPLLQQRYIRYLENLIRLTEKEIKRTSGNPEFNALAVMYNEKYKKDLHKFRDKYEYNIVSVFKRLQELGKIEIIACAATHGFLPLLGVPPESIKAQIYTGIASYKEFFNKKPKGIWLPECGYIPQIEKYLVENGIEYFITEAHGLLFANPRPVFGTHAPVVTPKGIVAFGRDIESSKQVWSSREGYPGDFDYREYYRDIGYDLDYEYLKNHMMQNGQRIHTGIKYYRITGKTDVKEPYNPEWAINKTKIHADDFFNNRQKQVEYLSERMARPPIIVCPYDAELFGHWWYEGPKWLHYFIKKMYYEGHTFKLTTLGEYISENPVMQVSSPCISSWGAGGYSEVWLNKSNDWIYRHLGKAAERMVELANINQVVSCELKKRALNQAARELLLAQSSDWAFIIKTGTMVQYAERRTSEHIGRFNRLYHDVKEDCIDEVWLSDIEYRDSIFPKIDYKVYSSS